MFYYVQFLPKFGPCYGNVRDLIDREFSGISNYYEHFNLGVV